MRNDRGSSSSTFNVCRGVEAFVNSLKINFRHVEAAVAPEERSCTVVVVAIIVVVTLVVVGGFSWFIVNSSCIFACRKLMFRKDRVYRAAPSGAPK